MTKDEIISALPDELKAQVSDRMFNTRGGKNKYLDAKSVEAAVELITKKLNKEPKAKVDYYNLIETLEAAASKKKMNLTDFIADVKKKNAKKVNKEINAGIAALQKQISELQSKLVSED